jgi:hypothetical protein
VLPLRSWFTTLAAAVTLASALSAVGVPTSAGASSNTGQTTVSYSATESIAPPSSNFSGASGGGDGWGVAVSSTSIYNVFHHTTLGINCHLQSDASTCAGFPITPWNPLSPAAATFSTSAQPAMYLDPSTGYLYVYAVRTDTGGTAGIACFNTNTASTCTGANGQPAGWTPLTPAGDSDWGVGGPVNGVYFNGRFYAYNPYPGYGASSGSSGKNALLCYDVAAQGACAGEPFAVNVGTSPGSNIEHTPANAETLIGSRLFIPSQWSIGMMVSCVDLSGTTPQNCVGSTGASWPQSVSGGSLLSNVAPIPYLSSTGAATGVCYALGTWRCWDLFATSIATPAALTLQVLGAANWDGPPVVVGTRVLLANNAQSGGASSDALDCFDFATMAACTAPGATTVPGVDGTSSGNPGSFPLYYGQGLRYIYTVNADPYRPTCVWLNANGGTAQIQNVDALTGGSCSGAPVRVYASSFVAPYQACLPTAFTTLSLGVTGTLQTSPAPTLSFTNANGVVIDGPYNFDVSTPATPTLDLTTLNYPTPIDLSTASALPQFVLSMVPGSSGVIGTVNITATWSGNDLGQCNPTYAGPAPSTLAATGVGDRSATLHGSITNPGTDVVSPVVFCYQSTAFTSTHCTGSTVSPSQSVAPSGTTAVSSAMTNLSPGTTYYYELEATDSSNANMVLYGGVQQFTTGPLATTQPVTSLSATAASLAGSLYNPANDSFTSVTFCYQSTSFTSGSCSGASANAVLNGTQVATSSYGLALTGLTASTTYYYEMIASGPGGTLKGGVQQFTTGPTATTLAASAQSDSGATINGQIFNPAGDAIATSFCYQTSAFASGSCSGVSVAATAGSAFGSFTPSSAVLTGLTPSTTYYYELIGSDSTSNTSLFGGVEHFSTGPTATTLAATSVTTDAATLHGEVFNPASDPLSVSFCVQTTSFASGACSGTSTAANGGGTIASVTPYGVSLSGLSAGTTYYYEISATTPANVSIFGGVQHFSTVAVLGLPSAPTAPSGTLGGGILTAHWSAPQTDGGTPVLSYTCVLMYGFNLPSSFRATTTTTSCTFRGLGTSTSYFVDVFATNEVGSGPSAVVVPTVEAGGSPGPTGSGGGSTGTTGSGGGSPGTAGVRLRWVGVTTGNLPLTPLYLVRVTPGGLTCRTTATSCYFRGLTPTGHYQVSVNVVIEIAPFAENSAALNARTTLEANTLVSLVERFRPQSITLAGYTDSFASAAYNDVLSAKRARSVGAYLRQALGARVPALYFDSLGESHPVVSNASVARASLNRRVEVIFKIQ